MRRGHSGDFTYLGSVVQNNGGCHEVFRLIHPAQLLKGSSTRVYGAADASTERPKSDTLSRMLSLSCCIISRQNDTAKETKDFSYKRFRKIMICHWFHHVCQINDCSI